MTAVRFKNRFQLAVLICLQTAFLCFSCAVSKKPHRPEPSEMAWDTKTSEQVLGCLKHDQERITSLTAAFSLSVNPPTAGRPANMRGVLFFSKRLGGTSLRIKGLGPFGRILFDLLQKENDLQIYIPSRKTLYLGKTDSTIQTQNVWSNMLGTMFVDYSKLKIMPQADLTFKNELVIVPLEHGKIIIDSRTGLIRELHDQKKVIFYDRYEQEPGLPPVPTHIEVEITDSALHAVCRLSHVRVNSRLSGVFDLSAYKPEIVRDLKELK